MKPPYMRPTEPPSLTSQSGRNVYETVYVSDADKGSPFSAALYPERRAAIHRTLCSAGVKPKADSVVELLASIDATILQFLEFVDGSTTFRHDHDALRDLFLLAHDPKSSTAIIRIRAGKLPKSAFDWFRQRAERAWSREFRGSAFPPDLAVWLQEAPAADLIKAVEAFASEGQLRVQGRRRPGGKRSASHFEPMVINVIRGGERFQADSENDGRTSRSAENNLIMWLAIDWGNALSQMPEAGRSDATPFGNLVHMVFNWLDLGDATAALRRFWQHVPNGPVTTA